MRGNKTMVLMRAKAEQRERGKERLRKQKREREIQRKLYEVKPSEGDSLDSAYKIYVAI